MTKPKKVNRMFEANSLVFGFIPFKLLYPFAACLLMGALINNVINGSPIIGLVIFFITFITWSVVTYKDGGKNIKASVSKPEQYAGGTREHQSEVERLHDKDSKNSKRRHSRR
jgi:hypothetical protein